MMRLMPLKNMSKLILDDKNDTILGTVQRYISEKKLIILTFQFWELEFLLWELEFLQHYQNQYRWKSFHLCPGL